MEDFDVPSGGLVLSRRIGEEIIIEVGGRTVAVVQVVECVGADRARLRVRARPDVRIDRAEVHSRRTAAARK